MYMFKDLFIYLKERKISSLYWFIPWMTTITRVRQQQSQKPGTTSGSLALMAKTQVLGPSSWVHLLGCMSRKLDWKKGSPKAQPGTPIWDASIANHGFTYCAVTMVPYIYVAFLSVYSQHIKFKKVFFLPNIFDAA